MGLLNKLSRVSANRVFIYDPLDNPRLEYSGAWNRQTILQNIDDLAPIHPPRDIFKTVLTSEDLHRLYTICETIKGHIQQLFSQDNLSQSDFERIANYQMSLNQLEIIEHHQVTKLITDTRSHIITQFNRMIHEFERRCADTASNLSAQSEELLVQLRNGIRYFDDQIQSNVNIDELEKRFVLYQKRHAARESAKVLLEMERKCRTYCQETNFHGAELLLTAIREKLQEFDQEFSQTGVVHQIDIKELEKIFQKSKTTFEQIKTKDIEQEDKIANLKKDHIRLREEQDRKEKEFEQKKRELREEQDRKEKEFERLQKQKDEEFARQMKENEDKRQAEELLRKEEEKRAKKEEERRQRKLEEKRREREEELLAEARRLKAEEQRLKAEDRAHRRELELLEKQKLERDEKDRQDRLNRPKKDKKPENPFLPSASTFGAAAAAAPNPVQLQFQLFGGPGTVQPAMMTMMGMTPAMLITPRGNFAIVGDHPQGLIVNSPIGPVVINGNGAMRL